LTCFGGFYIMIKISVTIQCTIRKTASSRLLLHQVLLGAVHCWLLAKEIFKNTFISAS